MGESADQVADAGREMVRIGIDHPAGAAIGILAGGQSLRSYPVTDFAGLAMALQQRPMQILDARCDDERAKGGVVGSQHIPLHELADRIEEILGGEVCVYCGSGYRASLAASILDRTGRQVVLINDSYDAANAIGLEGERPTEGAGATTA